MNIYPYVYKCVHKTTGQFYFGYRCANKLPAEIDLPKYKTSFKIAPNCDDLTTYRKFIWNTIKPDSRWHLKSDEYLNFKIIEFENFWCNHSGN